MKKRLIKAISRRYHKIRHWYPIWYFILNRKGRDMYTQKPLILNGVQKRIAEDLKKYGIALSSIDELFPGSALLTRLQAEADRALEGKRPREKGKVYLVEAWNIPPTLDLHNPFVKLVLDEKILGIVSGYLNMYPKFNFYSLGLTLPMVAGGKPYASQRWHRDPDDKKICKIFIYLNDVDENSGPFCYVKESQLGGKWRDFYPQHPPAGNYPPDGEVEKTIPKEYIKVATGKAGTVTFCDTSGLHKGGYAKFHERIMFTGSFSSAATLVQSQNIHFKYPANFSEELSKMTFEAAKYALQP